MADPVYTINGKTFAALGISKPVFTIKNSAVDSLTFTAPAVDFWDEPRFAFGDAVTIAKDSRVIFRGRISTEPVDAQPRAESIQYEAVGAWDWLERTVYMQSWVVYNGKVKANVLKSRVILGQGADGKQQTVAAAIGEVLNYARSAGAAFDVGSTGPGITIPWDEQVDISCAEAIRKLLRWSPDYVCWFDYSGSRPVFHCRARADLGLVTVNVASKRYVEHFRVRRRYEAQVSQVVIINESEDWTNEEDASRQDLVGKSIVTIDAYPAGSSGRAVGALVATIELAGGNLAYVSQDLEVAEIPDDLSTNIGWWKERVPFLASIATADISISDVTRQTAKVNEILEGQVLDWMEGDEADDLVEAKVNYKVRDSDGVILKDVQGERISVRLRVTDALGGHHTKLAENLSAEEPFTGLAKRLYDALNTPEYEGVVGLLNKDIPSVEFVGRVLNLAGGRSGWSTMRSIVQSASFDIEAGRTTIAFGPARHLSVQDFIEQLRANRGRRQAIHYLSRTSGDVSDSKPKIDLGSAKIGRDSVAGAGSLAEVTLKQAGNAIELKPSDITDKNMPLVSKPDGEGGYVIKPGYIKYHV